MTWLNGDGKVIFGNQDDRYYKARINNKVPLSTIIEKQLYNFPIEFRCQPFGYLLDGVNPIEITRKGTTIYNGKATHESLPLIIVYGSGSTAITINNRTFNITDINDGHIKIDSSIPEVLEGKGKYMKGQFPYLDIGENVISWSGNISKIEITPNWRCL